MGFVKENGRTIPVADKVFALSGRAKAAIAAKGKVIFTLVGYTAAMLWSLLSHCNTTIRSITTTYFLSVVILTALNKLAHFKASGHASSFTAPILLLVYFADWRFAIPGIIFAIAVCWSSIYLKRHTLPQLAGGMIAAIASFAIAISLIAH